MTDDTSFTGGSTVDPNESEEANSARRVAAISAALEAGDGDELRTLTQGLRAPDLADIIELLEPDERVRLIETLGPAFDPECCRNSRRRSATSLPKRSRTTCSRG